MNEWINEQTVQETGRKDRKYESRERTNHKPSIPNWIRKVFFFFLSLEKNDRLKFQSVVYSPPPQRKLFDYLENERKRRGKKAEKRKEKIEQHRVSLKFLIFLQDPRITPREANVWTKCSSALPLSKANTRKRREITEQRSGRGSDTTKKIVAKKRIELEEAEKFQIYAWFG